jgi:hypothetical protein
MNEILKLIEPIITILVGSRQRLAENSLKIPAELLNQLRKILLLVSQLMGSLILFCLAMSYFIERLLDQLDSGAFHFTDSLVFLTFFMLACLISIFYATKKSVWSSVLGKDSESQDSAKPMSVGSPIETAISLYILDVVKEREQLRAKTDTQVNPQQQ